MYAIELYVPKYNNAGESIRPEDWLSLEKQITDAFGGFTRYAGVGSFKGQEESVTVYRILSWNLAGSITVEDKTAIEAIADWVKINWQQETVLWTYAKIDDMNLV